MKPGLGINAMRILGRSIQLFTVWSRGAGLIPRASIVLDTRDGVLDAVTHKRGVGFMWSKGASRLDGFVQIPCREMRKGTVRLRICPEFECGDIARGVFSFAARQELKGLA